MALTSAARGDPIASALYNEIVDLVNGATGGGQPVRFTDYDSASTFSMIVGNQDTTNGQIARFQYGDPAGSPTVVLDITKAGIAARLRDKSGFEFNLEGYTTTTINAATGAAGSTDATVSAATDVAWATALAAAGAVNGTVIVGPGTFYGPTAAVTIPDNVIIKGSNGKGTTFLHRDDTLRQVFNFSGKTKVWLMDCTVDGNASKNDGTSGTSGGFVSDSEVVFTAGTDCGAMNVRVQNYNSYGFLTEGTRPTFVNCEALGQGLAFSSYVSPTHAVGGASYVTGKLGGVYGFIMGGSATSGLTIINCRARDNRSVGFGIGGDDCLMIGCRATNNHLAYWPDEGAGHTQTGGGQLGIRQIGATWPKHVTIADSIFGPSADGAPAVGLEVGGATDTVISGCHVQTTAKSGGARGGSGINLHIAGAARILIDNCTITQPGATGLEGISIGSTAVAVTGGVTISNCTFKDITDAAIKIVDSSDYLTLIGNRFTGCTTDLTDSTATAQRNYWANVHMSGAGTAIPNQAIMSLASNYAQAIRNTGGYGLSVRGSTIVLDALGESSGAVVLRAASGGDIYINDTSNANITQGLTIQQNGNDDQILALKSTDVAHGMTSAAETDTYAFAQKIVAGTGGLSLNGLDSTNVTALLLRGYAGSTSGTFTTGAGAAVMIDGLLKSGTTAGSLGATKSILAVRDAGTARFFLDSDGNSHQDVGTAWTNFDREDDIALLNTLAVEIARPDDPIKDEFLDFVTYNRADLERTRIVQFNEDGHHFANMSRLTMLLVGATRRLGLETVALRERLSAAEARLALTGGA